MKFKSPMSTHWALFVEDIIDEMVTVIHHFIDCRDALNRGDLV